MEAYATPNTSRFDKKRVRWNDGGDDDVSGLRRLHPHDPAGRDHQGDAQPLPALLAARRMEGFFYQPRIDRELLSEYAEGLIAHHRLPLGRGADLAAHRRLREGAPGGRRLPGHPRQGQLLPRADGPRPDIETRVREGLLRLSKDLGIPPVATNDSHYVLQEDAPSQEHLLCVSSGSVMSDPKRFRFDGDGYYIKSAGRDARALGRAQRPARGLRQHAADRRALRRRVHRGQRHLHAALPGARGRGRELLVRQGGREGAALPLPRRHPRRRSASRPTSRSA